MDFHPKEFLYANGDLYLFGIQNCAPHAIGIISKTKDTLCSYGNLYSFMVTKA